MSVAHFYTPQLKHFMRLSLQAVSEVGVLLQASVDLLNLPLECCLFSFDVHHSAVKRYVWLNTRRCRSMSPTENFKPLLGRAFVTQFGSFFLPRVLPVC